MYPRYWMRTILAISAILYYCAWVCFYLLIQRSNHIDITYKKLLFYYPNASLLLFYILIGKNGERYLAQFKKICLFSILTNFIIIIINWHGLISNTYYMVTLFCGLVFATSLMVLISGIRHGIFND